MTVEGRLGSHLRQRRHGDRQVLLQAFDRPHQGLGHHHPADAPAGHAEVFRKGVDDERVLRQRGRRHGRERVVQSVIDFVRDEADAFAVGGLDQRAERLARHHRSRGVGGTCDQHALQRFLAMRRKQHLAGQRVTRRRRRLDQHRLAAERVEDVTIRRIARHGDGDAVARLEHRQKGEDESARRSGRHHDAFGIDSAAIGVTIMSRDAPAQ